MYVKDQCASQAYIPPELTIILDGDNGNLVSFKASKNQACLFSLKYVPSTYQVYADNHLHVDFSITIMCLTVVIQINDIDLLIINLYQ